MKKWKLTGDISGVAGEYLVAGELSRHGYIASLTLRNTKRFDILATNKDASRMVTIQVKTKYGKVTSWPLNEKAEKLKNKDLFYVFVSLNCGYGDLIDYYIVPSKTVADFVKKYHQEWCRTHKDNPMRTFKVDTKQHLNRWDLLGL